MKSKTVAIERKERGHKTLQGGGLEKMPQRWLELGRGAKVAEGREVGGGGHREGGRPEEKDENSTR